MSYSTLAELAALGLPAGALAAVSSADQQAHLDAAYKKINSAIAMGGRYTPPLSSHDGECAAYEVDMARWTLLVRRGFNPDNPGDAAVLKAYDEAREWLEDVKKGRTIAGAVDATPTTTEQAAVAAYGYGADPRGWYNGDDTVIP